MTKFTLQAEAKGVKPIASYFICSRLQVRSVNLCNFCAFCFNIPRNSEIKINFLLLLLLVVVTLPSDKSNEIWWVLVRWGQLTVVASNSAIKQASSTSRYRHTNLRATFNNKMFVVKVFMTR